MPNPYMPWIKLHTTLLDDPRLGRLNERLKWRFIQLQLLAGECDDEGCLSQDEYPLSVTEIAWRLRLSEADLATDLSWLEEAGLISQSGGAWLVAGFAETQGRSNSEKRAAWRAQKQIQRDRQRQSDSEPEEEED
jgi:hypothetical protein